MRKVCFFSGDITRGGGTERVAILIANEISKRNEYEVEFLSLVEQNETPFYPIDEKINRYKLGEKWRNPGPGYLLYLPKLKRYLKEHAINIIIDIDIVLDSLSLTVAKSVGVKVVSWEHFNCNFEMSVLYRRMIASYAVKKSDYIVTLTKRDVKCFKERLGRTTSIGAIYNPMIMKDHQPDERNRELWIISVGRLVHQKGIEYLAQVVVPVLQKHRDWKWFVLGEGPDRVLLEEIKTKYHLQDQLILKGQVSEVGEYLEKASIYVMTSRYEGLPMSLLEAKAYKVPIVSFDIDTGPDEIICDGVNGYLITPFDCDRMVTSILTLMEQKELRMQFQEASVKGIEKFELEDIIEKWTHLFDQLTCHTN